MAAPTTSEELKRRRKQLLRKLPPLESVLRGTLIERYLRCGNPNCRCADGQGHGPKYYLSVSYPGILTAGWTTFRQAEYEQVSEQAGQLRPDSRDPGTDLRDQSRTPAPARAALRDYGEPGISCRSPLPSI